MNEGYCEHVYRKGNSVKSSGRFSELPDLECKIFCGHPPFLQVSSYPMLTETYNGMTDCAQSVCISQTRPERVCVFQELGGESNFKRSLPTVLIVWDFWNGIVTLETRSIA